jgi:hypothetical protein
MPRTGKLEHEDVTHEYWGFVGDKGQEKHAVDTLLGQMSIIARHLSHNLQSRFPRVEIPERVSWVLEDIAKRKSLPKPVANKGHFGDRTDRFMYGNHALMSAQRDLSWIDTDGYKIWAQIKPNTTLIQVSFEDRGTEAGCNVVLLTNIPSSQRDMDDQMGFPISSVLMLYHEPANSLLFEHTVLQPYGQIAELGKFAWVHWWPEEDSGGRRVKALIPEVAPALSW